jgi:uncharacterized membrane protein
MTTRELIAAAVAAETEVNSRASVFGVTPETVAAAVARSRAANKALFDDLLVNGDVYVLDYSTEPPLAITYFPLAPGSWGTKTVRALVLAVPEKK